MPALLTALWLAGCTQASSEAYWLQGADYAWVGFNHRVAHIEWGVDSDSPSAAVIGGTSTTGQQAELDKTCDPGTCFELPFIDASDVDVRWVHASSRRMVFARGSAELVATADGASDMLTVDLPYQASKYPAVALMAGVALDTDYPLAGGAACYHPAYGWHPQHIMAKLGAATLSDDRRSVRVPIEVAFQAGNSLEQLRTCIDEVNDQAQVPFRVDVVVAVTPDPIDTYDVSDAATYSYGNGPAAPDPQPDPDLGQRPLVLSLADPVVGWSSLDWRFHVGDPDDRGAYLRSLVFDADPDAGYATGHATNYSPITQLTGFDYTFAGTVVGLEDTDGLVETGTSSDTLPADLDADGTAVVHPLAW